MTGGGYASGMEESANQPEGPTGPDERGGYAERDDAPVSRQSGAGGAPEGDHSHEEQSDAADADAGGRAHTSSHEGHPAGTGARGDRDVGGPVADEDAEESTGGATGTKDTPGLDPH